MIHSSRYKFAFTGTNCSGKTTLALDVTARLKRAGVLAEVVSSQDRKITWKDDHFPVDYRAHYGMITNLIHAEVQAELKGDADVVITDRSVLDLYAIATYDHPDSAPLRELESMILAWSKSYHTIFYLEPLPYQVDNKRPADDFRMATHANLLKLIDKYALPNVVKLPRAEAYKQIKSVLGLVTTSVFAEKEKWRALADTLGRTLLVKEPASEISSDYDVWILDEPYDYALDAAKLTSLFTRYWGTGATIDVMLAPHTDDIPFPHAIYVPQV